MSQSIESVSREYRVFPPQEEFAKVANVGSREAYDAMYRRSVEDPDAFWLELAGELHWFRKPTQGLDWSNAPHAMWRSRQL